MDSPVITVENISKEYRISHLDPVGSYQTLRDSISGWLKKSRGGNQKSEMFQALKDVSFEVKQGEVLGIIGRNGAGKSTLLKILSRITEPTRGKIHLRGRVASLLEVGTGFHPELTGRENIFLNGAILGMNRHEIRRKFDAIVAFSGIEKFLDTPVKRYSSGMYVRLAFAVASHLEPEILVVDEVLAVGDIAFQKKCLGKMQEVSNREGRTVLFVSHNLHAIRQLCSSALLLDSGQIASRGDVSAVLSTYHERDATREPLALTAPEALRDQAYVHSIRLGKKDGSASERFKVGEAWKAHVYVEICRPMHSFCIALGIKTMDGIALQTAWSPSRPFQPGNYEVIFSQESVLLAAGGYSLVVGLSEDHQTIQQVEAVRLEVDGEGAGPEFHATAGAGLILNSMEITVHPR